MNAVLEVMAPCNIELNLTPMVSGNWSPDFQLAGENPGESKSSAPPQVTGNWQKQEDTETRDLVDDGHLSEFMEEIKRYIRNIDVSNL
jgi:hypothetical protein